MRAALLLGVLVLAACGGADTAERTSPGLAGTTLDGEQLSLGGEPVFVIAFSAF